MFIDDHFCSIPKDFRRIVLCNAVKRGGEKEWNFLWNRYLKSNVANEKSSILGALGCTKQIWLLNRYLQWMLDDNSGVRRQDMSSVFSAVASGDVGYYVAKDFLMGSIKEIYSKYVQMAELSHLRKLYFSAVPKIAISILVQRSEAFS